MPRGFLCRSKIISASPAAIAVIAGLSAAVGAVGGPYLTSRVDYFTRNREMDIKMVEIAVGVLRSDEKVEPGLAPARAWAADVIDRYSQIPLSPEARKSLIEFGVHYDASWEWQLQHHPGSVAKSKVRNKSHALVRSFCT